MPSTNTCFQRNLKNFLEDNRISSRHIFKIRFVSTGKFCVFYPIWFPFTVCCSLARSSDGCHNPRALQRPLQRAAHALEWPRCASVNGNRRTVFSTDFCVFHYSIWFPFTVSRCPVVPAGPASVGRRGLLFGGGGVGGEVRQKQTTTPTEESTR